MLGEYLAFDCTPMMCSLVRLAIDVDRRDMTASFERDLPRVLLGEMFLDDPDQGYGVLDWTAEGMIVRLSSTTLLQQHDRWTATLIREANNIARAGEVLSRAGYDTNALADLSGVIRANDRYLALPGAARSGTSRS